MKFDQVLYNGTIITMDETLSKKTWIAVKDGKIAALGEGEAYEKDADELIDLEGATVLPGLFDCHNHVPLAGLCLNSVDLSDAASIEEVLKRMEKACTEADEGEYVYGMNYVPQAIKETRYPTAKELDEICHGHLITIFAATLHGCCCNSAGMKIAQVPENLPGVEKINGEPTGVYTSDESSFFATSKILGSLSDDQLWQFIADCVEYGASQGLSNIHGLFGQFVEGDRDMKLFMERGESLPMGMTAFYQTWDVNKAKEMGLPRVGGCLTLDGAAFEYTLSLIHIYLPAVSGFLIEKEVKFLGEALENPKRPFVAIMGGAKVGDKIPVIENLMKKVDTLVIGGGMSYTFFKAMGLEIGTSILDEESIQLAGQLMKQAEDAGVKLLLPVDVVCAKEFDNHSPKTICDRESIPADQMGMDIGPKSAEQIRAELEQAGTVVWNGPMGVFEMPNFAEGTKQVAESLAGSNAVTIIGGGDSAAAVEQFGYGDKMTHISTGGGASLEFLEGKALPGIEVLEEKQ